jgi:hypothetical protein
MNDTQSMIGKLLSGTEQRDSIHIAVAPVIAAERCAPGQPVKLDANGLALPDMMGNGIGIVDPFLTRTVFVGQGFWLFLYPQTITDLRHHWKHPAFDNVPTIDHADHAEKSRQWIAGHAEGLGLSYDALMSDAERWISTGQRRVQIDSERWRDNFEATEFWHHYEVITGKAVSADDKTSFYCCTC